jgi:uncharacterized membrane protein YqaE (UPF0057 family)
VNTTLLFAELLVIGFQVSIWFSLLALSIFGYTWLQVFLSSGFANWQALIVVVLLSVVYVLGIVFDRLADFVFSGWDRRIRNQIIPVAPMPVAVMRFELGKDNEYLNRQFEYKIKDEDSAGIIPKLRADCGVCRPVCSYPSPACQCCGKVGLLLLRANHWRFVNAHFHLHLAQIGANVFWPCEVKL